MKQVKVWMTILLVLSANLGHGQNIDPWLADGLRNNAAAAAARNNAGNAAAQAEANRQWWAEENRIRANIARLEKTPFYGAIAIDVGTSHTSRGGGYVTKGLAVQRISEMCKTANCQVVATFANTCAMLAMPDKDIGNPRSAFIGFDDDGNQAILKSVVACERKYGQGNCSVIGNGKEAICSGYKYSIYNQK